MNKFKAINIALYWSIFNRHRFVALQWFMYSGYHLVDAVVIIINNYI